MLTSKTASKQKVPESKIAKVNHFVKKERTLSRLQASQSLPEVPIPLEWKTYDNYNLILLVDNPDNPALFNTMGGDVDNKIHLLSEYAGFEGDIENPYEDGTFAGAIKASEAACKGLIDQLSSWMK